MKTLGLHYNSLQAYMEDNRRRGDMTQRQRMAVMFQSRPNEWIPLPEILAMGVAQYGTRILELRRAGMEIENKTHMIDGVRRSWFRLVVDQRELVPSA